MTSPQPPITSLYFNQPNQKLHETEQQPSSDKTLQQKTDDKYLYPLLVGCVLRVVAKNPCLTATEIYQNLGKAFSLERIKYILKAENLSTQSKRLDWCNKTEIIVMKTLSSDQSESGNR